MLISLLEMSKVYDLVGQPPYIVNNSIQVFKYLKYNYDETEV